MQLETYERGIRKGGNKERAGLRFLHECGWLVHYPEILALVKAEHEATLAYVRRPVAKTTDPITSYFALVQDDPSIQIVTRAQTDYVRSQLKDTPHAKLPILSAGAPFKAGGRQGWRYYTDIPAGPLAIKNLADLYIYPNTLKVVKVKGSDVREWLERSAGQFNRIDPQGPAAQELINPDFRSYNFDTIDGVSYEIDVTQPSRYDMRDGCHCSPRLMIRSISLA